jgi:hypothetical protein
MKVLEVMENESWGKISGSKEDVKRGMNVIIRAEKKTFFDYIWRFFKSNLGIRTASVEGGFN